jgi:hypothetical protein
VKTTPRTATLVLELRRLAAEVEPDLAFASAGARDEWRRAQASWPSDDDLRVGVTSVSDGDLEAAQAKIRRFAEILRARAGGRRL